METLWKRLYNYTLNGKTRVPKNATFNIETGGQLQDNGTKVDVTQLSGITAGTAAASKAVVADANKDVTGLRNLTITGLFKDSAADAITAHAGGTQAAAVALTSMVNTVTTCATAGDSVALPASAAGLSIEVANMGAASLNVFPVNGGSDQINNLSANAAFAVLPGRVVTFNCTVAGKWTADSAVGIPNTQRTSISSGNGTLTGAQFAGASLTTLLSSGATALTTPTAAQILAAIPNGYVGFSYRLRIVNTNAGTLTITADATVTNSGTLTLATNTWREWDVTITGAATATMSQVGTGTTS